MRILRNISISIIVILSAFCLFISAAALDDGENTSEAQTQSVKSPFVQNKDETLTLFKDGTEYELYQTELSVDFNDDGKCTAYEARELLRISAKLSEYNGDIACIDVNFDGSITSSDARLVLRYSAMLDVYYTDAEMTAQVGFYTDSENNTYYIGSGGLMPVGLMNTDGSLYYFGGDRKMVTGLVSVSGSNYYFGNDGKACKGKIVVDGVEYLFGDDYKGYSGEYSESGNKYYYQNGTRYTGWYNDDGSYRYYNSDGAMATGKTTVDGTTYDFGSDGVLRNGFISSGGKTYYYANGVMLTGKQTLDGKSYYFYSDGHMAVNETVGGIYYDNSGVALRADKSFFDDAVFIGDSVSVKLASYQSSTHALGNAQFYAASSLSAANSLWEVSSKSVHPKYNGQKTLVEDCVKYSGAKKVFIMLGMNDIGIYSFDKSIANYKELVARILAKSPDVEIYIQSMTPMTSISTRADSKLNNTNIKLYNQRLKQMCDEMGWHYLDVASALYDSTGTFLPQEYCSDPVYMGLHMSDKGCEKWVEYLLNNAAFV